MNTKLNKEIIQLIKDDAQLQGAIANATKKSPQSVLRWAKKKNHERLTMHSTLSAIEKYTGKKTSDLLAA